jgi:hypothetical protein
LNLAHGRLILPTGFNRDGLPELKKARAERETEECIGILTAKLEHTERWRQRATVVSDIEVDARAIEQPTGSCEQEPAQIDHAVMGPR